MKPWQFKAYSERGADMGRPNNLPDDPTLPITLNIEPLFLVDGDYDEGGAYWGGGEKDSIYCAYSDDGVEIYIRAKTCEQAETEIRRSIPNVMFVRGGMDDFTKGYIEAALWSSVDENDNKKRAAEEAGYEVRRDSENSPWYWVKDILAASSSYEFEFEAWNAAFEYMVGRGADSALDRYYDATDIAPEALQKIIEDCQKFQRENEQALTRASEILPYTHLGHDFLLTRNHEGTGFWDSNLGTDGDLLTKAAHSYGETSLYVGDDGKIYVE